MGVYCSQNKKGGGELEEGGRGIWGIGGIYMSKLFPARNLIN